MKRFMALAALLLVSAGLAGCANNTDDDGSSNPTPEARMIPVAPDPAIFVGTVVNDHATGETGHVGHQVAELHTGAHNLELTDFNDLSQGLGQPSSGFTELHVVGNLGVVSSLTGSRGATLVNVTDPANIRVHSHITNLDDNWDARISDDQHYLFLGCQGSSAFDCTGVNDNPGEGSDPVTGGGPCAPLVSCPGGIAVYDIEDPARPTFLGYLPMGFTHNVYTFMRDDLHYFINAGGAIAAFDPQGPTFEIVSDAIEAVHDIAVQQHPVTGEWLLYSGSGGSMGIWNIDNAAEPEMIGFVDPADYPEGIPAMWHEQTPMPCMIDGRHITIGAGEKGNGLPEPVAVVDTTDPAQPVYLGQWKLPDFDSLTSQQSYRFSLHNVDGNCDGQVAVGHYHAGVWVFDISTYERQLEPVTLGYYLPHERAGAGWSPVVTAPIGALASGDAPNVWSAQWTHDGDYLFIPDMTTGLYGLQPLWETTAA